MSITAIIVFLTILGIMIFFHELGHFIVARLCGVRVNVFSIGFGKKILQYKYKDTVYCISIFPLGGYVLMAGENPMEEKTGDPGEFYSHPRWQRILIALAGPVANAVLAVVILTGLFMFHYEYYPTNDAPTIIGHLDKNGPAAQAGLMEGDKIVRIQEYDNPVWGTTFDTLIKDKLTHVTQIPLQVVRGDKLMQFTVKGDDQGDGPIYLGIAPQEDTYITSIDTDKPAYLSGMRLGDEIKSLNDTPVSNITEVIVFLQKNGDKNVTVQVVRNNAPLTFSVKPFFDKTGNRYRMGFGNSYRVDYKHLPFKDAWQESIKENERSLGFVLLSLKSLTTGHASIKQFSGPIGMAQQTTTVLQQKDWLYFVFMMMAMISINLGVMNLLPFPILDGGMIAITLLESLIRRDMNQQFKERIYQVAFVMIILFTVVVMYNDILKLPVVTKFLQ